MRRICGLFVVALLVYTCPVIAHDTPLLQVSFDDTGEGVKYDVSHEDADPFKGWVNVEATNNGSVPWGDFHFQIFQVSDPIDDVDFMEDPCFLPMSSQTFDGTGWVINNDPLIGGATIDLYFINDPVPVGGTASFQVYTDNTFNTADIFGVSFYPTPIPEPITFTLLGLGGFGLIRRKK
ncbi:MAG: PEP-CTERM sorting domain-containing protein [Sedimentisphaerales bacterium]|nr:PEP-CTERM sorting domain-containing protein [Sedimentisphaerales bacterium]